ncbi:MAG TPA: TonB-dependent receptor plug domain-containing protein [Bacteroidia bacterium]|nr:TonB-dependent receptor plug domain-containing protein [Bacteroidia bacterium]
MKIRVGLGLILLLFRLTPCLSQGASADTSSGLGQSFYDMSLEELMGIEVKVASMHGLTTRESPGVITLITEEEIESSGTHDLMDILRLVPGFDFGVDVEGVVGLAVRGNWAHEGKALLLIDGLEMNENLFSTLQFGNHYPVNDIKKIEIIRGPGSAIYGGNAEYTVINVITKSPAETNGTEIRATYGLMNDIEGRKSLNLSSGKQFGRFGYSVNYFGGSAIRSNRVYNDFYDGSFDMSTNSDIGSNYVNIGLSYNKLQFRGIIDKYRLQSRDNYDVITSRPYTVKFDSYIGELKQEIQVLKNLTITPKFSVKLQKPWNFSGEISSSRYTGSIYSSFDPTQSINISGGIEHFYDEAKQLGDVNFISTNSKYLSYNNTSIFAQASWQAKILNLTAGARYNMNDMYPSSFVPRIAITKVIDRVHFKALYSQAYRSPNTQNIDLNPDIQPEKTTVIEFESGIKFGESIYVTGNIFDITTKDPIIFYYNNVTDDDNYENSSETGTQGCELNFQWKYKKGYVNLSYGYYSSVNKNRLNDYKVPDKPHSLLGLPNQKIVINTLFRIYENYSINPTVALSGVKYGAIALDENEEAVIGKYDPTILVNIGFRAENLIIQGLTGSVSVHNLLDQNEYLIQPYYGGHAALPGASREIVFSLTYKLSYK